MGYQAVFKRYEIKYMVTAAQKEKILAAMEPYMEPDRFGRSTIRNLYFDTDDYVLARHSIAKPAFKEKLRIRSYTKATEDSTVFVELKRKYDGVVYKRRVGLPETEAMKWMAGADGGADTQGPAAESPQVAAEIEYFAGLYSGLRPVIYLSYDREAYRMKTNASDGSAAKAASSTSDAAADFRVTFDSNIVCRETDLTLRSDPYGTKLLKEGMFLMELKCSGGIPLWMTKVLSEEHIYKTSYSKYGTAYCSFMSRTPGERSHAIAEAGYMGWAAAAANQQNRGYAGRHFGKEANASGAGSRRTRKRVAFGGRATA